MATNADTDRLPANSSALASWFAEAVRAEIAALETNGGTQNYEVLAGRLIEKRSESQAVFRFIIADGARIPEEAAGKLKTSSQEYTATVIGQQADRIDLCVEGEAPLPPGIHRATLIIDDTALLRKLAQVLDEIIEKPALVSRLAVLAFHVNEASVGFAIIFDSVLDEPYYSARLCDRKVAPDVKRLLNVAVSRAKNKFILVGSSEWLNKHAGAASGLGQMWDFLKERSDLLSALELVKIECFQRLFDQHIQDTGWNVPCEQMGHSFEHLDETTFFERFEKDLNEASDSIFGLAPYFGEYRWPRVEPFIRAALARGVDVTLVTPPLPEAENRSYVEKVVDNLRELGCVVVSASGVHGKDVIIDQQIVYTGSMNWSSNRGRSEEVHRIHAPEYAKLCLQLMQAKHIRQASIHDDGTSRLCPYCDSPTQIVNQRRQHGTWDFQPMKIGCTNPDCKGYLRNVDERPPLRYKPLCKVDGRTKYRRVKRGKGEVWRCPKHTRECATEKVVPGDPT
ncbi:MAG: phospholipase D-like domain-containing protein [Acidobacteriota bacterium]